MVFLFVFFQIKGYGTNYNVFWFARSNKIKIFTQMGESFFSTAKNVL